MNIAVAVPNILGDSVILWLPAQNGMAAIDVMSPKDTVIIHFVD